MRPALALACALAALASGCRDDQDPAGARDLWAKINAGEGFRAWRRAPAYPARRPSFTAHANAVEIFVSPEVAGTLAGPANATEWPLGSIIVKEGYASLDADAKRAIVAVMEKRADGWFWVEYDDSGASLFSGKPKVCVDCHDNRKSTSDWVYSVDLPR